jgi:hypothetical protein
MTTTKGTFIVEMRLLQKLSAMTSVQYTQVYWSVNVYQILCISLSANIKRKALQLIKFLARVLLPQ